jgi:predicted RNase H-like nuclease
VAIVLENGRFAADYLIPYVASTFGELADADVIAIDVPIGFGPREADRAARAFLRGAASTVFTTPSREKLEADFGPGLGLSAQSHALGPRILHVTQLAAADSRIHEVHPEVSFRFMNNGQPLRHRKKSADGALQRLELLRRQRIELGRLEQGAPVPLDDVLDAAATAWSAHRIATGRARTLPDPPELVAGRRVAIWY